MRGERPIPLFDLGNVVVKVDFAPFVTWLAGHSPDRDPARALAFLRGSVFTDLEAGNVSPAEFARRARELFGAGFSQAELEEKFCDIFPGDVPGMPELLEELAAEGPVYALSNTNEIHLARLRARHAHLLRPFKEVFVSHELRFRKPHPEIYREAAARIGAPPERIVFFDDLRENVEGALRAGLRAHLFEEAGQVRKRLLELKGIADSDDRNKHGGQGL
jgi:putative hydrolase of the HAD superfamily